MIVYPHKKPGKKRKKKRGVSPAKLKKIYADVIERDVVCQNPYCDSGWPLDWPHHIIKRSAGGPDDPANLTLCCKKCHRLIHDEWLNVSGVAPKNLEWVKKD